MSSINDKNNSINISELKETFSHKNLSIQYLAELMVKHLTELSVLGKNHFLVQL